MKNIVLFAVCLLGMAFSAKAQLGNLQVKKSDKGLYIEHKVVSKEGLFSIGRIYHVHPHHLADFNQLDPNAGLNLGQTLRIPLTDTNFNQRNDDGLPVYYTVAAGDGLSAISRVHNRVPVERLRQWNNLRTDNINKGSKLIIGYLAMTTQQTASAETKPVPKRETTVAKVDTPVKETVSESEAVKDEVKSASEKIVEQAKEAQPAVNKQIEAPVAVAQAKTGGDIGGFFKPYFDQQIRNRPVSGTYPVSAGTFKTTSGWQDGKYYLLIDKVPTGSIVRITNPANNKVIYAKVLGEMNGIRQNQGLNIRISNAAAAYLGVVDDEKFDLQVSY
jgi:LysM repeat protein